MKTKAKPQTEQRVDVVYLRKSTSAQRDAEQRSNVELGLTELGVHIPDRYWYTDTRSRWKPEQGADFQTMMKKVDAKEVNRIFVESQDRFGAGRGVKKLFAILNRLKEGGAKLIDLNTKKDITSDETEAEIQALFNAKKSDTELLDTARRSLRSKLGKMTKEGGWPGGPPPIGYDKAYYHESGRLLWVFHHTGNGRGNQLFPDDTGELVPGPQDIHPPRGNREITPKLYPDPTRRHIVEDVFRWWTTESISLRQIAHRLNNRGDRMYTGAWTHANVTTMLRNPSYTGIVSYGRSSRAELQKFDQTGKIEEVKFDEVVPKHRPLSECPQKENAHPALVDRKTWDLAQTKFGTGTRKAFAPREAEYFLKGLLICGHCGRPLTPSSDKKKSTGKVYRKYICVSYTRGQATGETGDKCKAYQISTDEADKLVAAKLQEIGKNIDLDTDGRVRLEAETELLGDQADELREKVLDLLDDGLAEYTEELKTVYGMDTTGLDGLRMAAEIALMNPPEVAARVTITNEAGGSLSVADVRQAIEKVEAERVKLAKKKVADLEREHDKLTDNWLDATDKMKDRLKERIARVEIDQREWEARTVPLSARIDQYDRDIAERVARIEEIRGQWPEMELRQKGESLKGIFAKIVLFWGADEKAKITRYPLKNSEIEWVYTSSSQMDGAYSRQLQMRNLLLLVYRGR